MTQYHKVDYYNIMEAGWHNIIDIHFIVLL